MVFIYVEPSIMEYAYSVTLIPSFTFLKARIISCDLQQLTRMYTNILDVHYRRNECATFQSFLSRLFSDRGTHVTNWSINLELSFCEVCAPLMDSVSKLDKIYDTLRFFWMWNENHS